MRRIQNNVATSRWALPFSVIYGILVWLGEGIFSWEKIGAFAVFFASTYLIAEINNRNAVIRVRSRMVSCSFVFLSAMLVYAISDVRSALTQLAFTVFLGASFAQYKDNRSTGWMYYTFVVIGLASLIWVQFLYLVPFLVFILCRPLYSVSFKTLNAAFLGLLTPYWIVIPYMLYKGDEMWTVTHFAPLADVSVFFDYSCVTAGGAIAFVILLLLMVVGSFHFIGSAYKDKIRTRTLYNIFMSLSIILLVMTSIVPAYAMFFMPMLAVTVSPLISHFIVFTSTRFTNYFFIAVVIAIVTLTIIEVCWTPLFNYSFSTAL